MSSSFRSLPQGDPVGVIALQGGYDRHREMLSRLGAASRPVRNPGDMAGLAGLIIPGGESTTIGMLMERFGLLGEIRNSARRGLPLMGTCAGAILLAKTIEDSNQPRLGLMDITLRRNAYGRQIESFEAPLGGPLSEFRSSAFPSSVATLPHHHPLVGVFIRAPRIIAQGPQVETLAFLESSSREGSPQEEAVAVRQGNLLALSFHPELTEDTRVHELFLEVCQKAASCVA
ncbi:5'-phosphate synthase pdxT subunit [Alkalispirochaeta americana]|uniref:Pyridoxal 5'-phosphate synthase subunit PdxT n=1 Tax=Alkalispirochaeta americana TaxID=159291 RepID=A0A1N6P222_9SPIO|nr:pyridoxal 5'-phosphate synthase glutaminase subunit PdxT [Alkalispirochaeta americana]SIP98192.1 5'-phosphate synthase pdxT subunit [Alkalispirochaeta americana]